MVTRPGAGVNLGMHPCGAGLGFVGGSVQDSLHGSEQQHTQFWEPAGAKHLVEACDPYPVRRAEDPCSSNVRPDAFSPGDMGGQSSTSPDRPGGPTSHLTLRPSAQLQLSSVAETPWWSTKLALAPPGPRIVCWLQSPGTWSSRSTTQATEVVSNSPTAT